MGVFCNMAIIAELICLFTVSVTVVCAVNTVSGHYQENDRTFSKRLLLDDDYRTIINRLNNLTNDVGALKNEVEALKKENSLLRHPAVAFLVEKTKTLTGQNHHIYYDSIKLNIGNAYYLAHGNFIAPVKGIYLFFITACSHSSHTIVLELTVNVAVVGKVLAGDEHYTECTSKSFLFQLSAGDDVYVQHEAVGDYLYSNPIYGYPSFSGALLKVL
ncbi:heavy metal-binding protein HIP-like [Mytilus californianus]|uniref:heavy metal-binding protein HIP-like n=1 Tax=Mytilus californianus TaxID=6549 RepID=UPI0022456E13|nr:heavy metal-binding protein HIP-like [Mytilus californianus]